MKTAIMTCAAALLTTAGAAPAGELMVLTDAQRDKVTAGAQVDFRVEWGAG
jgi:hypothetical protein